MYFDTFLRPFIISIHKKGSALPRRIKKYSQHFGYRSEYFFMFPQSLSVLSLKVVNFYCFLPDVGT